MAFFMGWENTLFYIEFSKNNIGREKENEIIDIYIALFPPHAL